MVVLGTNFGEFLGITLRKSFVNGFLEQLWDVIMRGAAFGGIFWEDFLAYFWETALRVGFWQQFLEVFDNM